MQALPALGALLCAHPQVLVHLLDLSCYTIGRAQGHNLSIGLGIVLLGLGYNNRFFFLTTYQLP